MDSANSRDQSPLGSLTEPENAPHGGTPQRRLSLTTKLELGDGSILATAWSIIDRSMEMGVNPSYGTDLSRYQTRILHSESKRMSPDLRLTKAMLWLEGILRSFGGQFIDLKEADRLPYNTRLRLLRVLSNKILGYSLPKVRGYKLRSRLLERKVDDETKKSLVANRELNRFLGVPESFGDFHTHDVWVASIFKNWFIPIDDKDVDSANELSQAMMKKTPPMVGFIRPPGEKYKTSPNSPLYKVRVGYWLSHVLPEAMKPVIEWRRSLSTRVGPSPTPKLLLSQLKLIRKNGLPRWFIETSCLKRPDGSIVEPYPRNFRGLVDDLVNESVSLDTEVTGFTPLTPAASQAVVTEALKELRSQKKEPSGPVTGSVPAPDQDKHLAVPGVQTPGGGGSTPPRASVPKPKHVRTDLREPDANASVSPYNVVLGEAFVKNATGTRIPSIEEIREISLTGGRTSGEVTMFALAHDYIPESLKDISLEPVGISPYRGIPEDVRVGWFQRHGLTVGETESEDQFLRFLYYVFVNTWVPDLLSGEYGEYSDPTKVIGTLRLWRLVCAQKCADKGNKAPNLAKGAIILRLKEAYTDPPFHGRKCQCS